MNCVRKCFCVHLWQPSALAHHNRSALLTTHHFLIMNRCSPVITLHNSLFNKPSNSHLSLDLTQRFCGLDAALWPALVSDCCFLDSLDVRYAFSRIHGLQSLVKYPGHGDRGRTQIAACQMLQGSCLPFSKSYPQGMAIHLSRIASVGSSCGWASTSPMQSCHVACCTHTSTLGWIGEAFGTLKAKAK